MRAPNARALVSLRGEHFVRGKQSWAEALCGPPWSRLRNSTAGRIMRNRPPAAIAPRTGRNGAVYAWGHWSEIKLPRPLRRGVGTKGRHRRVSEQCGDIEGGRLAPESICLICRSVAPLVCFPKRRDRFQAKTSFDFAGCPAPIDTDLLPVS